MRVYKELSELLRYIEEDRKRPAFSPFRFINVQSRDMWIKLRTELLNTADELLRLSELCETDDTMPSFPRIKARLKRVTNRAVLLPFSECIRMNPESAIKRISDLLKTQFGGVTTARIYIPMYRMKTQLVQADPSADPRLADCVWMLDTEQDFDYSLLILKKGMTAQSDGVSAMGLRGYLRLWEDGANRSITLYTDHAEDYAGISLPEEITVMTDAYDVLRMNYALPLALKREHGTQENWTNLSGLVVKNGGLSAALTSEFGVNRFNNHLFNGWNRYSGQQRWMLFIWAKLDAGDSYLRECAGLAENTDGFIEQLYCHITEYLNTSDYNAMYRQRRAILEAIDTVPAKAFWSKLGELHKLDQLKCLTSLTEKERNLIFDLIKDSDNRRATLDVLRIIYPALASYAGDGNGFDMLEDSIRTYFEEYRWLKMSDHLTSGFMDRVRDFAESKGLAVVKTRARNQLVAEAYTEGTSTIIFVDGMGMEYADYLLSVLNNLDQTRYIVRMEAGHCNLPSQTEINKDFLKGRHVSQDLITLDELKHGGNKYPNTILQELAFLDTLKDKVMEALTTYRRVILTSDHGTSRMAVLVRRYPEYDRKHASGDLQTYKYGRYCVGTERADEFPTTIEQDGMLIFADYQRFEQKGAPADEIHGGASQEEWLVPVVIIEKVDADTVTKATIKDYDKKVKVNAATKLVTVHFRLEGQVPSEVSAKVYGQNIVCTEQDGEYSFSFRPKPGESTVKATIFAGISLGEITFTVESPIKKNARFDI